MRGLMYGAISFLLIILIWWAIKLGTGTPDFILPDPPGVAKAIWQNTDMLARHGLVTFSEILLGLMLGIPAGMAAALIIFVSRWARRIAQPILLATQATPVFVYAPLLVYWFGYGLTPKVIMAAIIMFFPVTGAFLDGLRRTDPGMVDLARTMTRNMASARWLILWRVNIPAALPSLASGIRVSVGLAAIAAVVGEWVGSSAGLGHKMLHFNAQAKVDLTFAALAVLVFFSVLLWLLVDRLLRLAMPWQRDSVTEEE